MDCLIRFGIITEQEENSSDGTSAEHSETSFNESTAQQDEGLDDGCYQEYNRLMRTLRFPEEINIAVIGSIKQGKSTLINTLLNYTVDENGNYPEYAAKVEESGLTTKEPRAYTSQQLKGVKLWDMPGIDGFCNDIDNYFEKFEISSNKFDFFVVVIAGEITTDAAYIFKELYTRKMQFYIVRTHADSTVSNGRRLSRQEVDVVRNVRVKLGNQIADLVRSWFTNGNENYTSLGYELYLVDACEQHVYDMDKLLKTIENNLIEKTQTNIQQKLNVAWEKILKATMKQLRNESESVINSCAKNDTIPFKAKSSEYLKFVLKCLQFLRLCIGDVEDFVANFQLQNKGFETFLDNKFLEVDQNLQAIRKGAKNLRFGYSDDHLSETAKNVLNGIQTGTIVLGGAGMAAGGIMVAVGYTAADVAAGTAATVTGGAVCGIVALAALPFVVAVTVGGISCYRYSTSKEAYKEELTKYLAVVGQISIDVHNEKVRLCKEAANFLYL
ncbi:T-cell-specific guanine nucleotide triphosphate-binding protein 2-like isoform X2 [Convolutriloba macropyga]|uniref:T-cell-specific guanine nucleotide triphosphate-binding protein 2-like isoform X2 n=1 Tax=Convolutriloba macropyga TaxID=536237 RepID=UPI003F51DC09